MEKNDYSFSQFLKNIPSFVILNILWVVCSIPVFTIGASTCAAYYVTLKMVDEEEGYVGKMFVKAFKDNFKQGTFLWLLTGPSIYVCYLMWQVISKGENIHFLIITGAILFTAFVIIFSLYAFPLLARYENTIPKTIKNSFAISTMFFPRTLFMVFIVVLECLIFLWNRWTMLAGILLGPELVIYTVSGITKRIFLITENNKA